VRCRCSTRRWGRLLQMRARMEQQQRAAQPSHKKQHALYGATCTMQTFMRGNQTGVRRAADTCERRSSATAGC
jgi:hypothetical protein